MTVQFWHPDVEQDKVGAESFSQLHCLQTVIRRHYIVAHHFEQFPQRICRIPVVIGDKNAATFRYVEGLSRLLSFFALGR